MSKAKLQELVTDGIRKVVTWVIMGILGAGANAYMDIFDLKKDRDTSIKNDDRHDSQITKLYDRQDSQAVKHEEILSRSIDKLDWIARELERGRRNR